MKEFGTTVRLTNLEGDKTIDPAYRKTTPDYTFIQGVLNSGAVASVTFRRAKKTVDNVGLRWLITGTKGEIEVVSPEGFPPIASEGQTIHVRSYDGAEAELVEFRDGSEPEHVKVPSPGTNTSRLYEAFAAGNKEDYSSFEDVLETQKLLDKIAKAAKFP
jgi:predicted dehydrogenase